MLRLVAVHRERHLLHTPLLLRLRTLPYHRPVRIRGVALAVEAVRIEAVIATAGELHLYLVRALALDDRLVPALGHREPKPGLPVVRRLVNERPPPRELVAFWILRGYRRGNRLPFRRRVLRDLHFPDARTAVRDLAAPELRERRDDFELRAVGKHRAEPGRRALVLVSPREDIAAETPLALLVQDRLFVDFAVPVGLVCGSPLQRKTVWRLAAFVRALRPVFSEDVGDLAAELAPAPADARRPAVGVDAHVLQLGRKLENRVRLLLPHVRDDRPDGMVRIRRLHLLGKAVYELPHLLRVRLAKLHLVAERIAEERRMVLYLRDRLEHLALGPFERRLVEIAEAVVVVAEPEAEHYGVAVLLRFVQFHLRLVRAPGAERVSADLLQQRLRAAAAAALYEIGLAVEREMPGTGRALDADNRAGTLQGKRGKKREECNELDFHAPHYTIFLADLHTLLRYKNISDCVIARILVQ